MGTVIETVVVDETRWDGVPGEFGDCLRESLFLLSLAPPEHGGTQSMSLFFAGDGGTIHPGQALGRGAKALPNPGRDPQ